VELHFNAKRGNRGAECTFLAADTCKVGSDFG